MTQTFQSATAGVFNLMALVASTTNTTAGGSDLDASSGATVSVYRLASVNTVSNINLGNIHVGGTFGTEALTVQNTAANDGYSESLDVALGATSGSATTNGGAISLLAPSGTDDTSLVVGRAAAPTRARRDWSAARWAWS